MRKSMFNCGLSAALCVSVTAGTAAFGAAAIECPCGVGVVKKLMEPAGAGMFKWYCTNESELGNFKAVYCPPAGGGRPKIVGCCVFGGGINDWEYIYGPDGSLCYIVYYNWDDANPDPGAEWSALIFITNVKTCTTTVLCVNVADDGTIDVAPVNTCVDEAWYDAASEDWEIQGEEFGRFVFPNGTPVANGPDAAHGMRLARLRIVARNRPGMARDLVWDTATRSRSLRGGDKIIIYNVTPAQLSGVGAGFTVSAYTEPTVTPNPVPTNDTTPAPKGPRTGTALTVSSNLALTDGGKLATVSSAVTAELEYRIQPVDEAAREAYLGTISCDGPGTGDLTRVLDTAFVGGGGYLAKARVLGDVSHDGRVNAHDIAALLGCWGTMDENSDWDVDGFVTGSDLAELLSNWGATGPKPE